MLNEVFIHQPISWLCQGLSDAASHFYSTLKAGIKKVYARRSIELTEIAVLLLHVSDEIEEMKVKLNAKDCRECCEQILWYLRIKLLHADGMKVRTTFIILDFLVKNNQNQIHYQLNRRRVMKTIGIVIRTNYFHGDNRTSALGLDIIQSWYIAFTPRAQMFPNIIDTYLKLKYKYCCKFPRSELEERVKIFLGPNCYYETSYLNIPTDLLINSAISNDESTGPLAPEEAKEISDQDLIQFDDIVSVEGTTALATSNNQVEQTWYNYCANPPINGNPFTSTNTGILPPNYFSTVESKNPFDVRQNAHDSVVSANVAAASTHSGYVTMFGNTNLNNPFMALTSEKNTETINTFEGLDLSLAKNKNKVDCDEKRSSTCNKLIDSSLESSVNDLFNDLKAVSCHNYTIRAPIKPPKPQFISIASTEQDPNSCQHQHSVTEQDGKADDGSSNKTVIDDETCIFVQSDNSLLPTTSAKSMKAVSYVTPGVDHNNVIKFYGNNRVVIKKS